MSEEAGRNNLHGNEMCQFNTTAYQIQMTKWTQTTNGSV